MYDKLNSFMNVETWHTSHALDEERFFQALHQIVREDNFNPDKMGEYMRQKVGLSQNDDEGAYSQAIERYVAAAWAVKDYLEANRL
ncbi:hypothetical protein [Aureimonas psammosilenae]|uniref:hypothetical protein n=1 Tax=Aureimonas psammosilenae TaxID=2495496 RepID=UPI001260DEA6|nr:hypothetical protein [Aureimonas psammosilenae]